MEILLTGVHLQVSPEIREHAEKKLGKLGRHLPTVVETKVDLVEEKTKSKQQRYLVRIVLVSSIGVFHGEERAPDVFRAIDKIAASMSRQIEHYKGKLYDKGRGTSLARGRSEESEGATAVADTPAGEVVKKKRFTIQPMIVEEAIDEMNRLNHSFFLFFNEEVGELRLLYRRRDGNYGIIEPEMH